MELRKKEENGEKEEIKEILNFVFIETEEILKSIDETQRKQSNGNDILRRNDWTDFYSSSFRHPFPSYHRIKTVPRDDVLKNDWD